MGFADARARGNGRELESAVFDDDDPQARQLVNELEELENGLEELLGDAEGEPSNLSLEDMERELLDLMSAEQQQQQQHAEPVAVAGTLTIPGGGVQFFTELNPGKFPKLFKQQPISPPGVEVEVDDTVTEDACSNGGKQHSSDGNNFLLVIFFFECFDYG